MAIITIPTFKQTVQKQPSCEKGATLKSLGEKSCEIKGGGQQMATLMLMLIILTMTQVF